MKARDGEGGSEADLAKPGRTLGHRLRAATGNGFLNRLGHQPGDRCCRHHHPTPTHAHPSTHTHTPGLQAGHALHSSWARCAGSAVSPAPCGPWGVAAHQPAESLRRAGTLLPPPPPTAPARCPAPRDYSASPAAPTPSSQQCGDKAAHTHTGATRVHTRPHTRTPGESHWRSHGDTHTHTHRHRLQPQAKPLAHTLIQMCTHSATYSDTPSNRHIHE